MYHLQYRKRFSTNNTVLKGKFKTENLNKMAQSALKIKQMVKNPPSRTRKIDKNSKIKS